MHPLSWGPDLAGAGAVEDEEGGGRRLLVLVSGNLLAPPFISQSLLPLALPLFLLGVGDALASLSALTPWRRLKNIDNIYYTEGQSFNFFKLAIRT